MRFGSVKQSLSDLVGGTLTSGVVPLDRLIALQNYGANAGVLHTLGGGVVLMLANVGAMVVGQRLTVRLWVLWNAVPLDTIARARIYQDGGSGSINFASIYDDYHEMRIFKSVGMSHPCLSATCEFVCTIAGIPTFAIWLQNDLGDATINPNKALFEYILWN